jgi:hypothetical protein
MNKKISTGLAIGIILIFSLTIGIVIWLESDKKIENISNTALIRKEKSLRDENFSNEIDQRYGDISEITVRDNIIYDSGNIQIGSVNNSLISMNFGDGKIFFKGAIDKIKPRLPLEGVNFFYYDELLISDYINGPYSMYKTSSEIIYNCDGPSLHYKNNDPMDIDRKDIPYYYCQTNKTDFLSQYEFSAAETGFATGDMPVERWYKLYIKKINNKNIFFIGELEDNAYLYNLHSYMDNDGMGNEKYKEVSSQNHLDNLLDNALNKDKIAKWDNFVENVN